MGWWLALWLAWPAMAAPAEPAPPEVASVLEDLAPIEGRFSDRRHQRLVLELITNALASGRPELGTELFWAQLSAIDQQSPLAEIYGRVAAMVCLEDTSEANFEECVAFLERIGPPQVSVDTWSHVALALRFRANVYWQLEQAAALLGTSEELLAPRVEHALLYRQVLRHRSELLATLGEEKLALQLARKAVFQGMSAERDFEYQAARLTLAMQEVQLGNPERALRSARELGDWFGAHQQPDRRLLCLLVQAEALAERGEPVEPLAVEVRALAEEVYADAPRELAETRLDLARVVYRSGAYATALVLFDEVLASPGQVTVRSLAECNFWRARTLVALERAEEASDDAEKAVAGFARSLPQTHIRQAQAALLAASLAEEPDLDEVEQVMERLMERLEVLVQLGESQALRFSRELHADLRTYLRLERSDDRRAYANLLRIKGVVGELEGRRLRALLGRHSDEPRQAQHFLFVLRQARAALALGADLGPSELSLSERLFLTQVGEEEALKSLMANGEVELSAPVTPEELQAALPPDGALLDLSVLDGQLVVFIVRPDRLVRVDGGPVAPIEAAARRFSRLLSMGAPWSALRQSSAELSGLALAPVWPELQGVRRVWLSPEGSLAFVPWGLMSLPDGRLMLETVELTMLPWASLLLREPSEGDVGPSVVLGAPDFGPPGEGGNECVDRRWEPLPASAVEARAVQRRLRGPSVLMLGEEASEVEVRHNAIGAPVLHLATHGFFGPPGCVGAEFVVEASMRQGLVFAGANGTNRSGSDVDGLMTAAEIALLDLRGTELVVLSACNTGLGEAMAGEGVQGLRRAFLHAGADQLVSALWAVPDADTARLMRRFYRELRRHPPAEALRRTQVWMLARDRRLTGEPNPQAWGAWVVTGATRSVTR